MHKDTPAAGIQITAVVINKAWQGAVLPLHRKPGASDVRKVKCLVCQKMSLCGKIL